VINTIKEKKEKRRKEARRKLTSNVHGGTI
jgi:hypothetical protein